MKKLATVLNLTKIRASLATPTHLATHLATRVGATIRSVRPGQVITQLDDHHDAEIRVRRINPFARAIASFRAARKPIPNDLLARDAEWKRTHR